MDGPRFDRVARAAADLASLRGFLGGLLGLGLGLGALRAAGAVCPPGQVGRRQQCLCRLTGRPAAGGACPCPEGLTDSGDGRGCLACRMKDECPPTQACLGGACGCASPRVELANGTCAHPCSPPGDDNPECGQACGGVGSCGEWITGNYCGTEFIWTGEFCEEGDGACQVGSACLDAFFASACIRVC